MNSGPLLAHIFWDFPFTLGAGALGKPYQRKFLNPLVSRG